MRKRIHFLVAAAILFSASVAVATTVIRMSLPECVANAERILEGRVLAVQGFRDENGMICSRVSMQVSQHLKGAGESVHEFLVPGGSFGDRRVLIPGMPSFVPGEETIVMLSGPSGMGTRVPVGLGQGKYRITCNARTGRKQAQREWSEELTLLDPATGAPVPATAPDPRDYEEFVAEIRQVVAAQKSQEKKQ